MDRMGRMGRFAQGGNETSKTRRLKELTGLTCLKEFKGVKQRGRMRQTHKIGNETDARQTNETDAGDRRTG